MPSLIRRCFATFSIVCGLLVGHVSAAEDASFVAKAVGDFRPLSEKGYGRLYKERRHKALAVNAAKESFRDVYAAAEWTSTAEIKDCRLSLTTLTETDGESRYRVFVDGVLLKEFQNPETETDYAPHVADLGVVDLSVGTVIRVECKPDTNGKIPEGDGTAWSRGRWTKLSGTATAD
ncbi:MAG: hypothetical protein AAGJ97_08730 [Planctomycetota bacterium]